MLDDSKGCMEFGRYGKERCHEIENLKGSAKTLRHNVLPSRSPMECVSVQDGVLGRGDTGVTTDLGLNSGYNTY